MEELIEISNRLIQSTKTDFKRSLLDKVDWNMPLIEIRGSRGVGKTTLLLQKAQEIKKNGYKVIYVSLDLPYFFSQSLFDFANTFVKYGGEYLFMDEIHRYPSKNKNSDWSLELKNIHDSFPKLKLIYSGSSILHLFKGGGDLSRRKASYFLNGLSFREYLALNKIAETNVVDFKNIMDNHTEIASELIEQFKPLPHFKNYLKTGYYPFYKNNEAVYYHQLQQVIHLIIDTDLPYLTSVSTQAKEQLKRLLGAISTTVPYIPNMKNLGALIEVTDHRTLLKYLQILEEAQIILLVKSDAKGNKQIQKPEKIFINNTNLMYALGMNSTEIGTLRETFFYNQLNNNHRIYYSDKADFLVNEKFIFEVGGKNKNKKQIAQIDNAFVVADDIEIGFGNKIPLWLFGMMY
jgi:predicted AAA+ superfamily ATPase